MLTMYYFLLCSCHYLQRYAKIVAVRRRSLVFGRFDGQIFNHLATEECQKQIKSIYLLLSKIKTYETVY